MAVTTPDGQLITANRSWEERLGLCSPEQAVLPSDRQRLQEGEAVRFLRTDGQIRVGRPGRHALDDGHTLTTLSDVSLDRVGELLEFLEAERHWLAVELHDGPAQSLVLARLENPDRCLEGALDELLACMRWLSSPALDGLAGEDALARLPADVTGTTEVTGERLTALYRVAQEILEGCDELARLDLAPGALTVTSAEFELADELRELVELRCELMGLALAWNERGARVTW